MNCCNNNSSNNNGNGHNHGGHKGHMSHMLMMALCCGAPIILLFLLPFLSTAFPGLGSSLRKIIPFLCPLMMVLMLPMMFRRDKPDNNNGNNDHCSKTVQDNNERKLLE